MNSLVLVWLDAKWKQVRYFSNLFSGVGEDGIVLRLIIAVNPMITK